MSSRQRILSSGSYPLKERTISTSSLGDSDITKRRSSRAIKRPKFADEQVESSLGAQSSALVGKIKSRTPLAPESVPPLTVSSSSSSSLLVANVVSTDVKKKMKSKRSRKSRGSQSILTKDLGRWKPTDDLALILGVQQTCDLVAVHRGIKFSCKFTLGEVQERWYALLYDPTVSRIAQQAMKNLHPDQIHAVEMKALFSKAEEECLCSIKSNSNPSLSTFEVLLHENSHIFFTSRTAKILFNHWTLMKHYHLLPDQTVQPLQKHGPLQDFNEAESQINDTELYESPDELLEHELMIANRSVHRKTRLLEDQVSQWQVIVNSVTGITPPDFDDETLAVLRGRLVRYLMRSKEITLGRRAAGVNVDVDLSLEGPAWKVSRKQGIIKLKSTGEFYIANEGKRAIFVDGKPILIGNKAKLNNNSVVEIAMLRFIFLINSNIINSMKEDSNKELSI